MAAPALNLSNIVIGGPCKITDGATIIYTEADVRMEPQATLRAIPSQVGGEHDDVIVDLVWKISFTPKSVYSYASVLVPAAYTNWTTSGARLIGAANRAVTILGSDGQQYALTRAIVTKMPDIYLGLGKSIWGPCEYTAFIGYTAHLADATAFWTASTGVAWSQTDYPTTHQEALCSAAWGAVTGFTAMFGEEGFQISHELKIEPVKQGNITVDYRLTSYRAMCTFKPQQPTEAQILAGAQFGAGVGLGIGTRLSAASHDLVITDGVPNVTVTLAGAAFNKGQIVFDSKLTRLGEWSFTNAATTPGSKLTLA